MCKRVCHVNGLAGWLIWKKESSDDNLFTSLCWIGELIELLVGLGPEEDHDHQGTVWQCTSLNGDLLNSQEVWLFDRKVVYAGCIAEKKMEVLFLTNGTPAVQLTVVEEIRITDE